jgi:hypothetical protein
MRIGSITTKISKNNTFKKGLELAANNGSLFVAGSQLALATVVRPFSILTTPKTDKENKKLACAKSFASSFTNYLMVLGVSLPLANNVKKIDTSPEKYLSPKTISKMTEKGKPLIESKSYQFATQMFKLGANMVSAIPRAIVTCALIPPIMSLIKMKRVKKNNQPIPDSSTNLNSSNNNLNQLQINSTQPLFNTSFKGAKGTDLAKGMGKVIDSPFVQKMSEKYKDTNFQMHTMALTDSLTTLTLMERVNSNKKIEPERKKILNYNSALSTSLGILSGYVADKALDKPAEKFIKKFSEVNKFDPKLSKYVEGLKIVKPTLIYGGIYYGMIPLASTFFAERLAKNNEKNPNKIKT